MNLKTSRRTAALATGLAVVAGSTLLIAGPASAAEIQVTQVAADDATYAGWHEGVATPGAPAVLTEAGLTMTGDSQIINGFNEGDGIAVAAGGFAALAESAGYASTGDDLYFQIPVYADGAADTFTVLQPELPGAANLSGNWVVTQDVPGIASDAVYTAAELDAALGDFNLLAFGVFAEAGTVDTLQSVSFVGDTYNFAAVAPVFNPLVVVDPDTIYFSDVRPGGAGFSVTVTGFTPGDTLSFAVTDPNGEIFGSADGANTVIADETGGFAASGLTLQGEGIQVGTYTFTVTDTAGNARADSIAVIADPVAAGAPAVPTLADTGSDSGVLVGGAAALLLLGAAGMLFAAARRKGAQVTA
ncbi:hypothetical protein [uncultured Plantibacter sp.]|uniref:hypothetical protein n=1 Tax=uncultured Plantibacter sp. TaxID=293337 RepID=UPI0028D14CFE|nr:hypothetical protein [uncultured Plantibacter sp.]